MLMMLILRPHAKPSRPATLMESFMAQENLHLIAECFIAVQVVPQIMRRHAEALHRFAIQREERPAQRRLVAFFFYG